LGSGNKEIRREDFMQYRVDVGTLLIVLEATSKIGFLKGFNAVETEKILSLLNLES
jgi:hypothetical protein